MEIERKFLVTSLPGDDLRFESIAQSYLFAGVNGEELRIRAKGSRFYLTIKSDGTIARDEIELEIDQSEYLKLKTIAHGGAVEKKRAKIPYQGETIEVDVFAGHLTGLVLAEVEFFDESSAAKFVPPSWFGCEVTDDSRYKNKNLAKSELSPPIR